MAPRIDTPTRSAELSRSPFAVLEESQFQRLESLARHIRRPSGSILYEEGETAVECYFTLDGVAEVFKRTASRLRRSSWEFRARR